MSDRIILVSGSILLIGVLVWSAFYSVYEKPTAGRTSQSDENNTSQETASITYTSIAKSDLREEEPVSYDRGSNGLATKYSHEDIDFLEKLNGPYGFSIEPFSRKLVWTSSGDETFKVANPDGTDIESIRTNFEEPYHIEVVNSFGYTLFYYAEGMLRKKTVDTQAGTSTEKVVLDMGQQQIHGLGFDEAQGALYVGDQFGQPAKMILLADNGDLLWMKKITPLTPLLTER